MGFRPLRENRTLLFFLWAQNDCEIEQSRQATVEMRSAGLLTACLAQVLTGRSSPLVALAIIFALLGTSSGSSAVATSPTTKTKENKHGPVNANIFGSSSFSSSRCSQRCFRWRCLLRAATPWGFLQESSLACLLPSWLACLPASQPAS